MQAPYIIREEVGTLVQHINEQSAIESEQLDHIDLLDSILRAEGSRSNMQALIDDHGMVDYKEWTLALLNSIQAEPSFDVQRKYVGSYEAPSMRTDHLCIKSRA